MICRSEPDWLVLARAGHDARRAAQQAAGETWVLNAWDDVGHEEKYRRICAREARAVCMNQPIDPTLAWNYADAFRDGVLAATRR